jgi:predicted membrane chloride channel (bestrophin family)
LFFLPFQLVGQFGYYTIPGVAIAAFIYLGFIAAGEEIEQPFGAVIHVYPVERFLIPALLLGYDDVGLLS